MDKHDEMNELSAVDGLEIEPLSDEALESVAGSGSSDGNNCCSCDGCSNNRPPV